MNSLSIKTFSKDDINFAMELVKIAGWNQTHNDWVRFIETEPEGCFLAKHGGKPAGTAIIIDYEKKIGWIGMVLVHPDIRHKGIGTALLQKAIDYLEKRQVETIKLDATPAGKPIYEKLGFVNEYTLQRWQGKGEQKYVSCNLKEIEQYDAKRIADFDMKFFGAHRTILLEKLLTVSKGYVFEDDGKIAGYIMYRPGNRAWYIGPWASIDVKENSHTSNLAEDLFNAALNDLKGKDVYIDILQPNKNASHLVEHNNFTLQRELTRMYKGNNRYPGKPENIYSIVAPEVG